MSSGANIEYPTISFDPTIYINLAAMLIVLTMCITTMCHYYAKLQRNSLLRPNIIELPSMSNINMNQSDKDELPNMNKKYDDFSHLQQPDSENTEITNKIRIDSISGPERGSIYYSAFIVTLLVMIICGSCNDFLGKLIYQMFPGNDHSLHGVAALKAEYWITYLLTFGSFAICSVAIFTSTARTSYHKLDKKLFIKICVPSVMDFFVTGGRYLGLVFLSGAVVSIMKNGTQLLFLALLRRCFHKKILKWTQLFGITITMCGLLLVALEKFAASANDNKDLKDNIIGITIMLIVGLFGAIRNDIEELLLKNDNLDSNFVVGMESIVSLLVTILLGVILFIIDPFNNIGNKSYVMHGLYEIFIFTPALIVTFCLFLIAIYGKDTMQMKMTSLSSSLTRKLFQQIYPSGTWIISLIAYGISIKWLHKNYGEAWEGKYSWIRLGGFSVVLIGNYFYIKGIPFSFFVRLIKRSV